MLGLESLETQLLSNRNIIEVCSDWFILVARRQFRLLMTKLKCFSASSIANLFHLYEHKLTKVAFKRIPKILCVFLVKYCPPGMLGSYLLTSVSVIKSSLHFLK